MYVINVVLQSYVAVPIGGIEQLLITQFIIKKGEDYQKISEWVDFLAKCHSSFISLVFLYADTIMFARQQHNQTVHLQIPHYQFQSRRTHILVYNFSSVI